MGASEGVGLFSGCKSLSIPQTGETVRPHGKVPLGRHRQQRRGDKIVRVANEARKVFVVGRAGGGELSLTLSLRGKAADQFWIDIMHGKLEHGGFSANLHRPLL